MCSFLPVNRRPSNEENSHNPETKDTSQSEKDYMSHISQDDFTAKSKDTKILMKITNTKRILRNIRTVMKVLIIMKLQILCTMIVLTIQPEKKKH